MITVCCEYKFKKKIEGGGASHHRFVLLPILSHHRPGPRENAAQEAYTVIHPRHERAESDKEMR